LRAICTLCNTVAMTLKDYLAQPGNTATKLAEEAEVSVSTITRAAEGATMPSRELMGKIFKATDGAVTPNDFYGIAA
jgi:transcriptional regulator with XRE-family HTH domain